MARQLTPLGWVLSIASGISLLAYAGHRYGLLDKLKNVVAPDRKAEGTVSKDDFGASPAATPAPAASAAAAGVPSGGARLNRPIRVAIVLWGGYAGGIVANNGMAASKDSTFFKDFG